MTFYGNRQRFEWVSELIGNLFKRLGLSANTITMLSIVPAVIAAYLVAIGMFIPAAAFFVVSAFLDMVDGAVARATGKESRFGAYLDTMVDRYVEFFVVLGLFVLAVTGGLPGLFFPSVIWLFIYYFGSIMTSYAKAAAKEKEFVRWEIKGGLVERAERLIILLAGIVLASLHPVLLTLSIVMLAVLTNVTALQRARIAIKESRRSVF